MDNTFEVTFLGTNGSCSHNNGKRTKYGTNTLCIAVKVGKETLIFDAGTGICGFTDLSEYQQEHLHLFFSHYHVDHIGGLLFFSSLFDPKKRIDLYGIGDEKNDFYNIVDNFLSTPFHPVGIESFNAKCDFHTIDTKEAIILSDKVTVHTFKLSHPGGSTGYRVEYGGKILCYCTDIELDKHQNDSDLLKFMSNADLLILDTFFHDGKAIPNWGHSNWQECTEWGKNANAKKLALFHYGFKLIDKDIDVMEEKAKEIFQGTFASADNMRVVL